MSESIDRRRFLRNGVVKIGAFSLAGLTSLPFLDSIQHPAQAKKGRDSSGSGSSHRQHPRPHRSEHNTRPDKDDGGSFNSPGGELARGRGREAVFNFTPFTSPLTIPPVKEALPWINDEPPFQVEDTGPRGADIPHHLIDSRQARYFEGTIKQGWAQILPRGYPQTEIWGFDGMAPGPTFTGRHMVPHFVRWHNQHFDKDFPLVIHNHGGHQSAHSDGASLTYPDRAIPVGDFRDFCYPHVAPVDLGTGDPSIGYQDIADFASTQWYHDHAHGRTSRNVYLGMAGLYLLWDELERRLIEEDRVLPQDRYDIPLVLQDKVLDREGQLVFDQEANDFNGYLGNTFTVNGVAQPYFEVERRKYRFRILDGSSARWYGLRFSRSHGRVLSILQIGQDSWLLPQAIAPTSFGRRNLLTVAPAERVEVIVDFSACEAGEEVFLENLMVHKSGRGPDGISMDDRNAPPPLMKFKVKGPKVFNDCTVTFGDPLRPHHALLEDPRVRRQLKRGDFITRRWEFERRHGGWVINDEFFNPHRDDAQPRIDRWERWILKNTSGGWWHPIHLHLEAHNILSNSRRILDPGERFKKDVTVLGPNEEVEILVRFRTFPGRFVFHCHNLEHEDHAMMGVFNVV